MPKRSRRSERAKLQRASGKPGFDSGFVEDAFDKLQNPDFELDLDINDQEDSDEEILVGGFNFSVADSYVVLCVFIYFITNPMKEGTQCLSS